MRLSTTRDLGFYVRDRRKHLGMTQSDLCRIAGVSRRWLSSLESDKPSAEFGLILKVLHALRLTLEANPNRPNPQGIDLDEIIERHRHPAIDGSTHA